MFKFRVFLRERPTGDSPKEYTIHKFQVIPRSGEYIVIMHAGQPQACLVDKVFYLSSEVAALEGFDGACGSILASKYEKASRAD
jgi:hypothetical protein